MFDLLLAAAAAAPALDHHDWEQFLQPRPLAEKRLVDWLGYQPKLEPETPAEHYLLRDRKPYPGGVDLFTDDHGNVVSARFYLAYGPIFTDEHIAAAKKLHTPYTLADVATWYGQPAEKTVSHRSGGTVWVYHFQGDAKRELDFMTLPDSQELHAVMVDRED